MEIKFRKIVKNLDFFFGELQQIVLSFFRFGQILFNFSSMFATYHE